MSIDRKKEPKQHIYKQDDEGTEDFVFLLCFK